MQNRWIINIYCAKIGTNALLPAGFFKFLLPKLNFGKLGQKKFEKSRQAEVRLPVVPSWTCVRALSRESALASRSCDFCIKARLSADVNALRTIMLSTA